MLEILIQVDINAHIVSAHMSVTDSCCKSPLVTHPEGTVLDLNRTELDSILI